MMTMLYKTYLKTFHRLFLIKENILSIITLCRFYIAKGKYGTHAFSFLFNRTIHAYFFLGLTALNNIEDDLMFALLYSVQTISLSHRDGRTSTPSTIASSLSRPSASATTWPCRKMTSSVDNRTTFSSASSSSSLVWRFYRRPWISLSSDFSLWTWLTVSDVQYVYLYSVGLFMSCSLGNVHYLSV